MVEVAYRAWRAMLYVAETCPYSVQDDVVNASESHNFTTVIGGELEEIILGEEARKAPY